MGVPPMIAVHRDSQEQYKLSTTLVSFRPTDQPISRTKGDSMAVPDYQSFMLPILQLHGDGAEHGTSDVVAHAIETYKLSANDIQEKLNSGQTRLVNRISWARIYLTRAGLLEVVKRGVYRITERGRDILASAPPKMRVAKSAGSECTSPDKRNIVPSPAIDMRSTTRRPKRSERAPSSGAHKNCVKPNVKVNAPYQ